MLTQKFENWTGGSDRVGSVGPSGPLGVLQKIIPLCGSILQAGTCQILSLAEKPRWSRATLWQWLTSTLPLVQMANHLDSLKIGDNTILIVLLEYSFLFLRVLKEYHHATCFCIIQNISKGPLFCLIIWKIDNIVRLSAVAFDTSPCQTLAAPTQLCEACIPSV